MARYLIVVTGRNDDNPKAQALVASNETGREKQARDIYNNNPGSLLEGRSKRTKGKFDPTNDLILAIDYEKATGNMVVTCFEKEMLEEESEDEDDEDGTSKGLNLTDNNYCPPGMSQQRRLHRWDHVASECALARAAFQEAGVDHRYECSRCGARQDRGTTPDGDNRIVHTFIPLP